MRDKIRGRAWRRAQQEKNVISIDPQYRAVLSPNKARVLVIPVPPPLEFEDPGTCPGGCIECEYFALLVHATLEADEDELGM